MFRSRFVNWVTAIGLVLGMGLGCDSAGCGACGVEIQPLPAGGLPADQTVEGGIQVRVTRDGFNNIEGVIRAVIADSFSEGMCVPKVGVGALIVDVDACYENDCAGGAEGCRVDIALEQIAMSVPDADTFRVDIVFDVSTEIDVRQCNLFGCTSCDLDVAMDNGGVTIDIGFSIRDSDGELEIALQSLDLDLAGFSSSGCGFLSNVLDFVVDVLDSQLGDFLIDLLMPVINDLIQGFMPDPLGLEGIVDVGALIGSVSPGTNALLEAKFVPGGYVSLPAEGLSLGLITGFNADEDTATRSADLDSEPAFCVPPFTAPDFAAAPHNLALSPRNTFKLDPANEFLGMPDPTNDLVIGVSETFLDLTGHHAVASGALCIGVGTALIPQLNLGLIGLLVPSLAELGSESGEDPLLLVLRPTAPMDFSIGVGTEEDPSLTIHFEDLDVDFYGFLFERYVRGFSIRLTMDIGINLAYAVDDMGNPGIEPQIVGLGADEIVLTVHNNEFLRESASDLEQVLPTIFDLAVPLIADGLGVIALPDISGFTLADIEITKVTTSEDDFLALYASLAPTMAMMSMFGEVHNVPGGALETHILANQLAPVVPVDTVATLTDVRVPSTHLQRAWMGNKPGGQLPEVILDMEPYDELGRELEFTWRLNGGWWHAYTPDSHIVISERQLALQGHHTVEVKARAVGQQRSVDPTPELFEFVVDSAGPRFLSSKTSIENDHLVVTAHDLVMPDETLEYAFAAGAGRFEPDTPWLPRGELHVAELRALTEHGYITVFTRDELGNTSSEDVDSGALLAFHGRTGGDSGCACEVGGATATGGFIVGLMAVAFLLLMGSGRRWVMSAIHWRRWRRSTHWMGVIAFLGISWAAPACSCDGDPGSGPACEVDSDCDDFCPEGEIGVCIDGRCVCVDDIPPGKPGQYSELALSSNSTAWVSAYSRKYGDLMIARWPESGRIPEDVWEFVDGVPEGPVVLPDSEVRGGISDAGDDVGLYTSIAVSAADVVHVSYFDKTNASLKYATNANGTWEHHTVDAGTVSGDPELGYEIIGQYSSITVRADDGSPGIAYFAQIDAADGSIHSELRFAAASSATPTSSGDWSTFIVDEITVEPAPPVDGDPPDPYIIPEGTGLFISADRAPDGAPVIGYYDRVNGDLKLVRFDSAAGAFGVPVVMDGVDTDVGWYPSVTVDDADIAHIGYLSATSDDLLYINETDMLPELVDDGFRIDGQTADGLPLPVFHFVGDDSSVVITSGGPVLIYQDATTHELLIAQQNAAGNWEHQTVAGDEDPFIGGYGFYASAQFDGTQVVMSNWVIDPPVSDTWVEIHRQTVVVQ